jgi:hypothetical protein
MGRLIALHEALSSSRNCLESNGKRWTRAFGVGSSGDLNRPKLRIAQFLFRVSNSEQPAGPDQLILIRSPFPGEASQSMVWELLLIRNENGRAFVATLSHAELDDSTLIFKRLNRTSSQN